MSTALVPSGAARARMLLAQVGAEVTRFRRIPEYLIGVVAIPVLLYAMFALPSATTRLPGGTPVGAMTLVSFTCFGVLNQALFSFGAELADERGKGWLRRLRATPMPMWVYFAGKLAMNLVFALMILAGVSVVTVLLGGVRIPPARLGLLALTVAAGCLAFSPMGAMVAYWVRPRAASAIANLVFLPLSFVSGFLFPLAGLPGFFRTLAPWLPSYHFGLLAWRAVASTPSDVRAFGSPTTGRPWLDVAVVAGWCVLCTVLTAVGYRRDLDRERG